jgi:hypothetical protein
MKKTLALALVLLGIGGIANATRWVNGVLYGNVCRSGYYYFVYPWLLRALSPTSSIQAGTRQRLV